MTQVVEQLPVCWICVRPNSNPSASNNCFRALNLNLKGEERSHINNLSFYTNKVENQNKINSK
jgi:hypothetical protein